MPDETSKKFLGSREKALEEMFFEAQNSKLIERMRVQKELEATQEGLARVSGIEDAALLAKLVELEIGPETWAALSLVPLLEVAWADDELDGKERAAILQAAEATGIQKGTASYELLGGWLEHRPDARLLQVWGEAIVELCEKLGPLERGALEKEVLGRAREVAEASGGFLGLGKRVSAAEQEVLDRLEKAFARS